MVLNFLFYFILSTLWLSVYVCIVYRDLDAFSVSSLLLLSLWIDWLLSLPWWRLRHVGILLFLYELSGIIEAFYGWSFRFNYHASSRALPPVFTSLLYFFWTLLPSYLLSVLTLEMLLIHRCCLKKKELNKGQLIAQQLSVKEHSGTSSHVMKSVCLDCSVKRPLKMHYSPFLSLSRHNYHKDGLIVNYFYQVGRWDHVASSAPRPRNTSQQWQLHFHSCSSSSSN